MCSFPSFSKFSEVSTGDFRWRFLRSTSRYGNIDGLNRSWAKKKSTGVSCWELPRAEKIIGRSTNINILYILINVTKFGECYSALNRIPKLIIEKDMFLFYLFGRNRVFSYFLMLLFTIPANIRKREQIFYIN